MRCVFRLFIGPEFRIVKCALNMNMRNFHVAGASKQGPVWLTRAGVSDSGIEKMGWWLFLFRGSGIKGQAMIMKCSEFRTDKYTNEFVPVFVCRRHCHSI